MKIFTGGKVRFIKLKNEQLEVTLVSVGAAIDSIKYHGIDMVLSADDKQVYRHNNSYQGAIVGPSAGRIENAKFTIDDKQYQLKANFLNKHNLHGSDIQHLDYDVSFDDARASFTKTIYDQYYQAELDICITYELIESCLELTINVRPNADTIINMTNHTYFNLGFDSLILDHELTIPATSVWYLDEESLPREKVQIENSILDFRASRRIGDKLIKHEQFDKVGFIDHPFELKEGNVTLYNPNNKISMQLTTNKPYIVVYTGNYLAEEKITRNGQKLRQFETICLEPGEMPNAINIAGEDKNIVVRKDEQYTSKINYKFSKEN